MRIFTAVLILVGSIAPSLPGESQALRNFHKVSDFNYLHLYGPPVIPGTSFAYYDGAAINCAWHTASYRGQDGRRYPCIP